MNESLALLLSLSLFACASTATEATTIRDAPARSATAPLDTAHIEELTGWKGTSYPDERVFKVSAARTDVPVTVDGRKLEPFLGLTSWVGFTAGKRAPCMVMGDLVLFQDEIGPVMSAALESGLSVTALHNHFTFDEPRVYFMHVGGEGTEEVLARGVRAATDAVKRVRAAQAEPRAASGRPAVPSANAIPAAVLDAVLMTKGQAKDGMYKAVFGRKVAMPCDCTAGTNMGVNTWAAFAGDAEHALVDGDFVTFAGELQPVLKSLRASGIDVVAIHSHMEGETPKAIFLHYWGVGPAEDLARAVKRALDAQGH